LGLPLPSAQSLKSLQSKSFIQTANSVDESNQPALVSPATAVSRFRERKKTSSGFYGIVG